MPKRLTSPRDSLTSEQTAGIGDGPTMTLSGRVLALMRADILELRL